MLGPGVVAWLPALQTPVAEETPHLVLLAWDGVKTLVLTSPGPLHSLCVPQGQGWALPGGLSLWGRGSLGLLVSLAGSHWPLPPLCPAFSSEFTCTPFSRQWNRGNDVWVLARIEVHIGERDAGGVHSMYGKVGAEPWCLAPRTSAPGAPSSGWIPSDGKKGSCLLSGLVLGAHDSTGGCGPSSLYL